MTKTPNNEVPETVVGEGYRLEDLINMDDMKRMLDDLYAMVPFPAAIRNLRGDVLLESHWSSICTRYHRANPETAAICTESDTHFYSELPGGDEGYVLYKCGNGLCDAAAPIEIGGQHLGNFYVGQFLMEAPDEDFFRKQAKRYDFPEEEYLEALAQVPIIAEKELESRLNYLCGFARFLGNIGLKEWERGGADEALKASEAKFRDLSDLLPQIVYEINLEGSFTYVNKIAPQLIGYTAEEIEEGLNFTQLFSEEDNEKAAKNMQKIVFERELGVNEYTLIKKNGDLMPILVYSTAIFENDKPCGLRGIALDLTEQKKAEDDLRKSKERYHRLFATNPYPITTTRLRDGLIEDVNESFVKVTGFSRDEAIGKTTVELGLWEEQSSENENLNNRQIMVDALREFGKIEDFEIKLIRKDGDGVNVLLASEIVELDGEPYIFSVLNDITRRKQAEAEKERLEGQLQQALKMEAIGTLSGGIAHDFNNILGVIMGCTELS
ncbi:MAG: PocR ligand-binding domain-containing protein, partial [Desulfobacterales bacterium]